MLRADGRPRWQQILFTDLTLSSGPEDNEPVLTLSSVPYGLLELLANPGQERFRLSAYVRLENLIPERTCRAGIYVGRSRFPGLPKADDFVDGFITLGLAERASRGEKQLQGDLNFNVQLKGLSRFAPRAIIESQYTVVESGQWHALSIDLGPELVFCRRDEEKLKPWQLSDIRQRAAALATSERSFTHATPRFSGQDGVGLFISEGTASFRNVRIELVAT